MADKHGNIMLTEESLALMQKLMKMSFADIVEFSGTDGSSSGTKGIVPAPAATDMGKFLCGDGTWKTAGGMGANVIVDTLWENTAGTVLSVGDTLTLSHPYTDYDYLLIEKARSGYNTILVPVTDIIGKTIQFIENGTTVGTLEVEFTSSSASQLTVSGIWQVSTTGTLIKISGLKFCNPDVYSTTEKRIGTWIDGKPLYQITLTGNMPSTTGANNSSTIQMPANAAAVHEIKTIVSSLDGSGNPVYSATITQDGTVFGIGYDVGNNIIVLSLTNSGSGFLGLPVTLTVKYTKTTD